MPLEILTGTDMPALMAKAQRRIGEDAVVLSVRRTAEGGRTQFELVAADPATAERQRREERPARRGAEAVLEGERQPARFPGAPNAAASLPVSRPFVPAAPAAGR